MQDIIHILHQANPATLLGRTATISSKNLLLQGHSTSQQTERLLGMIESHSAIMSLLTEKLIGTQRKEKPKQTTAAENAVNAFNISL